MIQGRQPIVHRIRGHGRARPVADPAETLEDLPSPLIDVVARGCGGGDRQTEAAVLRANHGAIVQMQQVHGNRRAQRLLQRSSSSAIQRCGATLCDRPPAKKSALASEQVLELARTASSTAAVSTGRNTSEPPIQRAWWDDEAETMSEENEPPPTTWQSEDSGSAAEWVGGQAGSGMDLLADQGDTVSLDIDGLTGGPTDWIAEQDGVGMDVLGGAGGAGPTGAGDPDEGSLAAADFGPGVGLPEDILNPPGEKRGENIDDVVAQEYPNCIDEAKRDHFGCLKIANTGCSAFAGMFSDLAGKAKVPLPGTLGGMIYGLCEAAKSKTCEDQFEDAEKDCEKLRSAKP